MKKLQNIKNGEQHSTGKKLKNDKAKAKKELNKIIEITERQNRALRKMIIGKDD